MEYMTLNNGIKCPVVGIGTFMLSPADAERSVREALKMGYSLVDTANACANECAVGRGMRESGAKHGKTPAQVILRWHTQMGFAVIPGSRNVEHIRDNLNILDFALTDDEMAEIAKLDRGARYYHRTDEQLAQFAAWKPDFERA